MFPSGTLKYLVILPLYISLTQADFTNILIVSNSVSNLHVICLPLTIESDSSKVTVYETCGIRPLKLRTTKVLCCHSNFRWD